MVTKGLLKKGLLLSFLFALICSLPAMAQLGGMDFRSMNVDALSDAQLRQINQEIMDRGITVGQFEQLAIAQGGDPAQVRRLSSRLQEVRLRGEDPEEMLQPRRPIDQVRLVGNLEDVTFEPREADTETTLDSLKIFGMDLFSKVSVSFEPSFNVPTPENYQLGPGDQLIIDVWGAAEMNYQLLVDAEGTVRIPNLGPIQVSGMTIEEANDRVIRRLSSIYSGLNPDRPDQANTFARVSLGNIRSIKVSVIGEVNQPGTYTVSSMSTLFNALYSAGGPNETGTFREIQLIRNGQVERTFDIYDFLVFGTQEDNVRLRDQDIIKVDPYKNRVHVWGETKRKGFFELKEGETVKDLLTFAAGFTDKAYTRTLTLRGPSQTMRRISTVYYPEGESIELRNGDQLIVGELLDRFENRVTIEGAVFRPGEYELEQGMTLFDLINRADGLREDASQSRGIIQRLNEFREPVSVGFIIRDVLENPARFDIPLQRDDVIHIPSIFDLREEYTVRVSGAVNTPVTIRFRENMTIEDAILMANGFQDEAAAYRVEVARRVTGTDDPDQFKMDRIAETFTFNVEKDLRFDENAQEFVLMPFDQIYVRTQPNYQEQQTVTITGEVQYPGEYVIMSRNARLSDLVEWAGGLSDYAYTQGASMSRVLRIERVAEEFNFVDDEKVAGFRSDTLITQVGIRLDEALRARGSNYDLILEPGDVVHIPKQLQTVRIEGEVLAPTSVRYERRLSFNDYIDAAGGVTDAAQRKRAYIVYANGEVDRSRKVLFFRNNPKVEPGATIVIPREPERREMTPQERISLASSIASTALLFITLLERIR